jgi:hypothetical protein
MPNPDLTLMRMMPRTDSRSCSDAMAEIGVLALVVITDVGIWHTER